jgi:hypothetical protein
MATLSCGHEPTWTAKGAHAIGTPGEPDSFTTGTAHTLDGFEICHVCAEREEEKRLQEYSTACAYLDSTGKFVTSWTGGILASVRDLHKTRAGFSRSRHYFQAKDNKGNLWSGSGEGPGMFCRLKRVKR